MGTFHAFFMFSCPAFTLKAAAFSVNAGHENIKKAWKVPIEQEATEKLYERHCLVIKIVSSFFASLTKFSYL